MDHCILGILGILRLFKKSTLKQNHNVLISFCRNSEQLSNSVIRKSTCKKQKHVDFAICFKRPNFCYLAKKKIKNWWSSCELPFLWLWVWSAERHQKCPRRVSMDYAFCTFWRILTHSCLRPSRLHFLTRILNAFFS